jgi:aspartyl protease family protein
VIVAGTTATINESTRASFVVDTGASYTMISQAMARELNIDLSSAIPKIPFQTANGTIMAPLVTLESIEIGGLQVKDLSAAVHDIFPDPGITGLLGLNFLSQFRIDIDTQNGVLVLEKR